MSPPVVPVSPPGWRGDCGNRARPDILFLGELHREDKRLFVNDDARHRVARPAQQFAAPINVVTLLDALRDGTDENGVMRVNGQRRVFAKFVPQGGGGNLAFLQRRAVANVAGRFGRVFGQTKFLIRAFAESPHDLLLAAAGTFGRTVDVHGGMGQVHRTAGQPLARWIENVAVALLDGRGDFHFGLLFQFADLALLVVGEFGDAVGFNQFGERQTADDFLAHFLNAGFVGNDKNKMVAQPAQTNAVAALALEYASDDFGDGVHRRADGNAVISHDGETGATIAEVVIHFTGRGGKWNGFKD